MKLNEALFRTLPPPPPNIYRLLQERCTNHFMQSPGCKRRRKRKLISCSCNLKNFVFYCHDYNKCKKNEVFFVKVATKINGYTHKWAYACSSNSKKMPVVLIFKTLKCSWPSHLFLGRYFPMLLYSICFQSVIL